MTAILDITGREILDSRGNPTVEVDVRLEDGSFGRAAVPSGASTGAHEAVELRDGGKRYGGKGVEKAVAAVNGEIFDALCGLDAEDQIKIDRAMIALDGTPNKARLGANAILGVSLAVAKAAAAAAGLPLYRYVGGPKANVLPVPMMNIINGGVHADNPIDFQEFMIMPVGAPTFREAPAHGGGDFPHPEEVAARRRPQHQCRRRGRLRAQPEIAGRGADLYLQGGGEGRLQTGRGSFLRPRSGFDRILQGRQICAGRRGQDACRPTRWSRSMPISASAIPSSPSRTAWRKTTGPAGRRSPIAVGKTVNLVGDDLFVTNVKRLKQGIETHTANAILIKVNQIGSLTETLETVEMAHKAAYKAVMSHRSGETEDSTIADLAVATNCGQIKTGSLARSDRLAKYNQLLRIEEQLGDAAVYAGARVLRACGRANRAVQPRPAPCGNDPAWPAPAWTLRQRSASACSGSSDIRPVSAAARTGLAAPDWAATAR